MSAPRSSREGRRRSGERTGVGQAFGGRRTERDGARRTVCARSCGCNRWADRPAGQGEYGATKSQPRPQTRVDGDSDVVGWPAGLLWQVWWDDRAGCPAEPAGAVLPVNRSCERYDVLLCGQRVRQRSGVAEPRHVLREADGAFALRSRRLANHVRICWRADPAGHRGAA